jgi:glycosyltransferase involved in cell wall biosynthesis
MNNFNDSKSDIKVAECSRYKIPLVASNVGCYEDTIINGETGYLIDPDAPKSEWIRILTKLCKDKKHRIELGRNLHERTKDLFDGRKSCQGRYDLYMQAMQQVGYKLND